MSVLKNLTNMRFGRLVVQERADDQITKNGESIVMAITNQRIADGCQ